MKSVCIILIVLNIFVFLYALTRKEILLYAIEKRHFTLAKAIIFISLKSDLSARDWYGFTPLHLAAREGDYRLTKLLISRGANVHARSYIIPMKNQPFSTPLHVATQEGNMDIALLLKEHGSVVNAWNIYDYTPLYFCDRVTRKMMQRGNNLTDINDLPLIDNVKIAESLLSDGMDINEGRGRSLTLLHRTVSPDVYGGEWSRETAEYLVSRGADVNAEDSSGITPLGRAVIGEKKEAVEFLLANGAKLNTRDNTGMTPLHFAADTGNEKMVLLLLEEGAKREIRDDDGRTALDIAKARGHKNVVLLLKRYKQNRRSEVE